MAIVCSRWIGVAVLLGAVAACGGGGDEAQAEAVDESAQGRALAAAPVPAPPPGTNWVNCATEGGNCALPESRTVRYGANGSYLYKTVTGSIACTNAVWGDPLFGVVKGCDYAGAAAPPPPPPPAAAWVNCAREGSYKSIFVDD